MKRVDIYQAGMLIVSEVPIHLITKHRAGGGTVRYGTLKPSPFLALPPGTYEARQDNGRRYDIMIAQAPAGDAAAEVSFVVSNDSVKE